ncbi:protein moonraker [Patella vulgata]|uniref:protein moonraker n=1 Tax=Patella vulgata TaxID=6465 RepID=UPI0024A82FBC|nr:protein moonraker [Patella vulgata]XP_050410764.2 protein moonraker [Patella vulgata]
MAAKSFLQLNQLQFNLNVPPTANNLMYRQFRPEPIKIERLSGRPSKNKSEAWAPTGHPLNTSQFSAISEDRLSAAVLLAKRDLKNQRIAEQMRANQARSRTPSPNRGRSRIRTTHGKNNIDAKKGVGNVHSKVTKTRESLRNKAPRTPPKPVVRANTAYFPATTNSPPTRDTDKYPIHKVHIPISDTTDEITRMQKELESYLSQIKTIEEKAITDENTNFLINRRSRSKDGYLSDEEDIKRRAARSEEQLVRTARNLYNLRQQVRQIQKDFLQLGTTDIKQTKKSQAVAKLTAAHRGAVRSMQAFVHQLPHQDLRQGLPTSYRELALLIRQLTMLNTQIERGQDRQVNNNIISILDRVDELNNIWTSDIRGHHASKAQLKENSLTRPPFVLDFNQDKPLKLHQKFYGKENKTKGSMSSHQHDKNLVKKHTHQRRGTSPARKSSLRAGLVSLLKPTGVAKKTNVAFQIPSRSNAVSGKRSLMLPGKLQSKREKINRFVQQVPSDSHFADPTIATNLKAVAALSNPILDERPLSAPSSPSFSEEVGFSPRRHHKEPWIPPGSPNSKRSPSAEGRRSYSDSPGSTKRYHIEDVDNNLIKRLFSDKAGTQLLFRSEREGREPMRKPFTLNRSRSISPRPTSRSPPLRARSPRERSWSPRRRRSLSESMIEDIAEEVRRKLKSTKDGHQFYKSYPADSRSRKGAGGREDELTDMILDDVLRDTVHGIKHIDNTDRIHQHAISLQDSPTVQNLFHRLQQMEDEQEDIRRRWECVSFHDPKPKTKYFSSSEILSDRPRSPVAIEVLSSRGQTRTTKTSQQSVGFSKEMVAEPIIFTKPKHVPKWTQNYIDSESVNDDFDGEPITLPHLSKPKRHITIPQTIVTKIEDNRDRFQNHLKKISHHPLGRFDPWKLVEEITEKIMDDCLLEVAHELDDLNEDMANHMYKSEFLIDISQSSSPTSALIKGTESSVVHSQKIDKRTDENFEDDDDNSDEYEDYEDDNELSENNDEF